MLRLLPLTTVDPFFVARLAAQRRARAAVSGAHGPHARPCSSPAACSSSARLQFLVGAPEEARASRSVEEQLASESLAVRRCNPTL